MKTIILGFLIVCLSLATFGQSDNPLLKKIVDAVSSNDSHFSKTKVFIKTDKDIYAPGEKIWFKAEVYNCLTQYPSEEPELIVMLKGESGEVIADNKYVLEGGICSDEITIPGWAFEGDACLVAYTPNAIKTNDASLSAIKPVTIKSLKRNDFSLVLKMNRPVYKPGEEARLDIHLIPFGNGRRREKIYITLYDYTQKRFSEMVSVQEEGFVKFKIPEKISNGLYLDIRTTGKSKHARKLPLYTTADPVSIEFYPEGGALLTNNLQRILYRTTDPFGKPVDVSGNIYDTMKNHVGIGKPMKNGYGLINLMPVHNQKYFFILDGEYGKNQEFVLPEAVVDGCVFSLQKTEDSTLRVLLTANGKYIGDTITLAAFSKGMVKMAHDLVVNQKNSLKISTSDLPGGVILFTVLHPADGILSERLVYNTPNQDINIDIHSFFTPSEKNGDLSVSVNLSNFIERFGYTEADIRIVDKFRLYNQDGYAYHSFLKYPLLTPVPKNVLDIYLTNLELIANEYRHYSLNDLLGGDEHRKKIPGKTISGYVTDKNRKPVSNATVMAVQRNNLKLASATTGPRGTFTFENLPYSGDIMVKAFSSSGKKSYTVHLDRSFNESLEEMLLTESFKSRYMFEKDDFLSYYNQNKELLRLAGAENRTAKTEKISGAEKFLQSGSTILDVIKMTKPFRLEGNQIVFFGSSNSLNYQSGALIVIDGQKMGTDISVLNTINPFDVKSINISTNAVDIQRYTGLNSVGIIEINTRQGPDDYMSPDEKTSLRARSVFDALAVPPEVWKYQTTLFWGNNLPVSDDGKIELHLKASEIRSEFVVQVEAISESGFRHHQISTFSAQNP